MNLNRREVLKALACVPVAGLVPGAAAVAGGCDLAATGAESFSRFVYFELDGDKWKTVECNLEEIARLFQIPPELLDAAP